MIQSKKTRILIAEENSIESEKLKFLLEDAGYQVIVACNGKEVTQALKKNNIDIVLINFFLPEKNGYNVCKEIKFDPSTSEIPVILLILPNNPGDVLRAFETHADDVIIKPYQDYTLLTCLEVILTKRSIKKTQKRDGIDITYQGEKYTIESDRLEILPVLISAVETAVKRNYELADVHKQLADTKEQLSDSNSRLLISSRNLQKEIGEREIAEKALFRLNKLFQVLNSIIRHDILNQVAIINGYSMLMLEIIPDPDELITKLTRIQAAGEQIQSLIEFTRNYQEFGVQPPVWLRVKDIFSMRDIKPFYDRIDISVDISDLEIFTDRLFEKIFYILIDNTVCHGLHATQIRIGFVHDEKTLVLVYEDNGKGISDAEKEKIFKQGYGINSGLGLFLIREILALTGIVIRETGKEGEGVRFEMIIPEGLFRFSTPLL